MIDDDPTEPPIDLLSMVLANAAGVYEAPIARAVRSAKEEGTTLFVASSESEDRAMDVVRQNWRLGAFKRNPVILDNHSYSRVVGTGTDAWVPRTTSDEVADDMVGNLLIRVKWDLANPIPALADVGRQHLDGFRRAGSVGFRPGKRTERHKLATDSPYYREPIEVETWYGGSVKVSGHLFESPELCEFSSATVPANPEAVQRALGGDVERDLHAVEQMGPDVLDGLIKRLCADERGLDAFVDALTKRQTFLDRLDARLRASGPIVRGLVEAVPLPASAGPTLAELVLRRLKEQR